MSVLEQAKKHFAGINIKKIDVPEWGCTIYAKPLTLKQKGIINAIGDNVESLAELLIMKAQNEQGEKLFRKEDSYELLNKVDPDVLSRVASAIMTGPTVEEQEGN